MRSLWVLTVIIVGLVTAAGLGSSIAAAPRIALVIGNSAYEETPLANPVNDARLMAEARRGRQGESFPARWVGYNGSGLCGPAPITASIRFCNLSASSGGSVQSMQLNWRMSK